MKLTSYSFAGGGGWPRGAPPPSSSSPWWGALLAALSLGGGLGLDLHRIALHDGKATSSSHTRTVQGGARGARGAKGCKEVKGGCKGG